MLFRKKTYSEIELIAACSDNDRRAQEYLYRKYFSNMMGLMVYHVRDREKAMEIVNQGFLKVFKKINTVNDPKALGGWIKTTMMRTRADYFRSDAKYLRAVILEEPEDSRTESNTLSDLYFNDIVKLIEKLPPASAEVFRLFAIEGYKHNEIADKMGISTGTSKWHLSAARTRLKELIQEHYDIRDVG